MKKIKGITAGAFDLLHAGHITMFEEAKNVCDHLTVAIQIDPHIDRPNKNKPSRAFRMCLLTCPGRQESVPLANLIKRY